MITDTAARTSETSAYSTGSIVLLVAAGTILTALGFEHLAGYAPCPLCLQQRYAYYIGVPALFVALVLLSSEQRRSAAVVFFLVSLGFLANAGLGVYQSGAEWGFWPGPETCSGAQALTTSAQDLFSDIENSTVVSCTEVQWRFAGLSFAGWNAVVSLALFAGALKSAFFSVGRS